MPKNNDDFIEAEIIPSPRSNHEGWTLELKKEIEEELNFQYFQEKKQAAITRVIDICESRVLYNQTLLESIQTGKFNIEELLKNLFGNCKEHIAKKSIQKYYHSMRIDKKAEIINSYGYATKSDANFYRDLIYHFKHESNAETVIELVMICVDNKISVECQTQDNLKYNENNELFYLKTIKKLLLPYLSRCYDAFRKDLYKGIDDSLPREITTETKKNLFFKNIENIIPVWTNKLQSRQSILKNKLDKVSDFVGFKKIIAELNLIGSHTEFVSSRSPVLRLSSTVTKNEREKHWQGMFSVVFILYQQLYELEIELNYLESWYEKTFEEFKCIKKIQSQYRINQKKENLTPLIDKEIDNNIKSPTVLFLAPTPESSLELEAFKEKKMKELTLWKESFLNKKLLKKREADEMKTTMISFVQESDLTSEPVNHDKEINLLLEISMKMTKNNIETLETLFGHDSKAIKNIKVARVFNLIENCSASSKIDYRGSHFSFILPDTKSSWKKHLSELELNPTIVGKAWKPHSGDKNDLEWNLNANNLLKKAFEQAGITPQRIEWALSQSKKMEIISGL
ncbi:MAG: hypothetical protein JWM09_220 [Francisellaceae bacterium]|nr:hypothetical protein [Francisellaceae bacterium]